MQYRFPSAFIIVSVLAAAACGGTTQRSGDPSSESLGGEAGTEQTATGGRVIEGAGGAPSIGGSVGVGGTIPSVGGSGGTVGIGGAVVGLGGTVGVGGGAGAPADCPLFQPSGVCTTDGITCVYEYFDGCLCQSTADYYCEPSPECWGTGGTTGMGGMTSDGGIGAASGESGAAGTSADWVPAPQGGAPAEDVDMPAPTVTICTCDDVWACTMTWL